MMIKVKPKFLSGAVMSSLFAALISCAFFFVIPLPGGVPVVLQDSIALLSGLLLGPVYGGAAVLIYLVLGGLGLPVFSGKAGFQVILNGPTGGFLIGYFVAAVTGGVISRIFLPLTKKHSTAKKWIVTICAAVIALLTLYVCGVLGFIRVTSKDVMAAVASCVLPFLPVASVKLALNVILCITLRPVVFNALYCVEIIAPEK